MIDLPTYLRYPKIVFTLLLFHLFCISCQDEFTTNGSLKLHFSTDTIQMDTLFTTLSSSTRKLMVYNPHDENILIERIDLLHAGMSGFVVNVDGIKGETFQSIEINKNDSLHIFIEAKMKPTSQNQALRVEDLLTFQYNGVNQQVVFEAFAQDAFHWRGKVIGQDTVLTDEKPILVYDSLYIAEGVHLELQAGTQLFLHNATNIQVAGKITAAGTLNQPVVIRGNRPDKLFANLPYDQMPGQWGSIHLKSTSFENSLTHTHIRGMNEGICIDSTDVNRSKLSLHNCVVKNANEYLIRSTSAQVTATNSEFSVAGKALFLLTGGKYRFTHCTLAHLSPFSHATDGAIVLRNYEDISGEEYEHPLLQADFNNCIIWGKRTAEIDFNFSENPDNATQHRFDHCLIKANGEDDENFINTQWNVDPVFKKVDPDNYTYDFRIDSLSAAIGTGNGEYAQEIPTDIIGNPRLKNQTDIGCYQYTGTRE